MYCSYARLEKDGGCTLLLAHDDEEGEEIGRITPDGDIKADYLNDEWAEFATLQGLLFMGLKDKYEEVEAEIKNHKNK